jgi:hypothetical protein
LSQTISHPRGGQKPRKILLIAGIADHAFDSAASDVEGGDQGLCAVAAILEFASLDLAGFHRQSRCNALQGLNAGHLVDRDRAMPLTADGCGLVNFTNF